MTALTSLDLFFYLERTKKAPAFSQPRHPRRRVLSPCRSLTLSRSLTLRRFRIQPRARI